MRGLAKAEFKLVRVALNLHEMGAMRVAARPANLPSLDRKLDLQQAVRDLRSRKSLCRQRYQSALTR